MELMQPVATGPEARTGIGFLTWLEREEPLAYVLLAPALLFLALFVGYPFLFGVWLSLSDRVVGHPGSSVGAANFLANWGSSIYQQTVRNTLLYTAAELSQG